MSSRSCGWIVAGMALALLGGSGVAGARGTAPGFPRFAIARSPAGALRSGGLQAVDPGARNVVYAGGAWSRDGGTTWEPTPLPSSDLVVYAFASSQRLVYRLQRSALARSSDGGRTWVRRGLLPEGDRVGYQAAHVAPFDANTICLEHFAQYLRPDSSLLSDDGGSTWQSVDSCSPHTSSTGHTLVADLSTPHSLYAADFEGQLALSHSADGGETWSPLALPDGLDPAQAVTELADPVRPGTIVVYQLGRLWQSRNTGQTWQLTPRALPAAPEGFDRAGVLYVPNASPMRSTDDGASWTWRGGGLAGTLPTALGVDQASGSVYLFTTGGQYSLGRDRTTWRPISTFTTVLPFAATGGRLAFLTGDGRVIRSGDGGRSAAEVDVPTAPQLRDQGGAIVALGTSATMLAISAQDTRFSQSDDAGLTWTQKAGPAPDGYQTGITVVQPTSTTPAALLERDANGTIQRSVDLGASWAPFLTAGADTIEAATADAVYLAPRGQGLAIAGTAGTPPRAVPALAHHWISVVVSSTNPALALALTNTGSEAFLTRDAGATWTRLTLPVPRGCGAVAAVLTPAGRLVAAFWRVAKGQPAPCAVATIVSTPLA